MTNYWKITTMFMLLILLDGIMTIGVATITESELLKTLMFMIFSIWMGVLFYVYTRFIDVYNTDIDFNNWCGLTEWKSNKL